MLKKPWRKTWSSSGDLQNCATPFKDRTSRNRNRPGGLSGRAVGRVQARRATVQAHRTYTGCLCKFAPRRVARNGRRVARLFTVPLLKIWPDLPCFWCYGGTELRLNLFKNDTFTHLFHSYDISNVFNGSFIFFLSCQKNSVGLLTQRGLFSKQCYFFPIFIENETAGCFELFHGENTFFSNIELIISITFRPSLPLCLMALVIFMMQSNPSLKLSRKYMKTDLFLKGQVCFVNLFWQSQSLTASSNFSLMQVSKLLVFLDLIMVLCFEKGASFQHTSLFISFMRSLSLFEYWESCICFKLPNTDNLSNHFFVYS